MVGERNITMFTVFRMSTLLACEARAIPSPVQKEEALFTLFESFLNLVNKKIGTILVVPSREFHPHIYHIRFYGHDNL